MLVTQCDQGRARGGTGKLYSGEEQVGSGRTFQWNLEEPGGITQVKHGMGSSGRVYILWEDLDTQENQKGA